MSKDKLSIPECACFESKEGAEFRSAQITQVVQGIGCYMVEGASMNGLCDKTFPLILENAIIQMATIIAIKGTAIDMGSQEAQSETERVLNGIEEKVLNRLRAYYDEARSLGVTEEVARAMFSKNKGTIQ